MTSTHLPLSDRRNFSVINFSFLFFIGFAATRRFSSCDDGVAPAANVCLRLLQFAPVCVSRAACFPVESQMIIALLIKAVQIIVMDIVLSGDNAVVIAMAAHKLPPYQRQRAILWGGAIAILLRIMFT